MRRPTIQRLGHRMYQPKLRTRNYRLLWLLLALTALYTGLLALRHTFGSIRLDGSLGVLLGLFTCSRPAANFLDMLFSTSTSRRSASTRRGDMLWIGLNLCVLVAGFIVIVVGTTRFASADLGTPARALPG
jgi:hypothetical protein